MCTPPFVFSPVRREIPARRFFRNMGEGSAQRDKQGDKKRQHAASTSGSEDTLRYRLHSLQQQRLCAGVRTQKPLFTHDDRGIPGRVLLPLPLLPHQAPPAHTSRNMPFLHFWSCTHLTQHALPTFLVVYISGRAYMYVPTCQIKPDVDFFSSGVYARHHID